MKLQFSIDTYFNILRNSLKFRWYYVVLQGLEGQPAQEPAPRDI